MMASNNALIPGPDKEDTLTSTPTDWPLMWLGLRDVQVGRPATQVLCYRHTNDLMGRDRQRLD